MTADNLYVAARLADRDPSGIISLLGRRDESVDSDWFYFGIDPYLRPAERIFFRRQPGRFDPRRDALQRREQGYDLGRDLGERGPDRRDGLDGRDARSPSISSASRRRTPTSGASTSSGTSSGRTRPTIFAWSPKEESGLVSRFADLVGVRDIDPGSRLELLALCDRKGRLQPGPAGESVPDGTRVHGQRRLRPQGRPEEQPDPRRHGQSRLRPGRGRPRRHQHQRPGNLLP